MPPAFSASAARYRPTGHPSVRRTSSTTSVVPSSTPAAASKACASGSFMARSRTPISTTVRRERSNAVGRGGFPRVATASCEPSGSRVASSAMASRHSGFSSSSAWSSTRRNGAVRDVSVDEIRLRALAAVAAPGDSRLRKTPASTGSSWSRATAALVSRTDVSLSSRSIETQASLRCSLVAHWASNVVLP